MYIIRLPLNSLLGARGPSGTPLEFLYSSLVLRLALFGPPWAPFGSLWAALGSHVVLFGEILENRPSGGGLKAIF